jgi:UTP:GlnB (protein PII) uridylyltransferase
MPALTRTQIFERRKAYLVEIFAILDQQEILAKRMRNLRRNVKRLNQKLEEMK